jgi:hypothetical protein
LGEAVKGNRLVKIQAGIAGHSFDHKPCPSLRFLRIQHPIAVGVKASQKLDRHAAPAAPKAIEATPITEGSPVTEAASVAKATAESASVSEITTFTPVAAFAAGARFIEAAPSAPSEAAALKHPPGVELPASVPLPSLTVAAATAIIITPLFTRRR